MTDDVLLSESAGDTSVDVHRMARGDTRPAVEATLLAGSEPFSLDDARHVTFRLCEKDGVEECFENRASIVDEQPGHVRYEWGRGETDTPGLYRGRFVVNYRGRESRSFPNRGHITVIIER